MRLGGALSQKNYEPDSFLLPQRRNLLSPLSKSEIHTADVPKTVLASPVDRESIRTEPGIEAIKLHRANLNAVGYRNIQACSNQHGESILAAVDTGGLNADDLGVGV